LSAVSSPVTLSVVVVAHEMARELPRTLRSLTPAYQRGVGQDYEVIVVDNGSDPPLDDASTGLPGAARWRRIEPPAPASPAAAANAGLELAGGDLVGLMIDGARIASPGLLAGAMAAARVTERPVIATLGWHLGTETHMDASEAGYDQETEDRLLADSRWLEDGYRLFAVSTLSGSSRRGWFGPIGESNALFMRRETWAELGGLDERFELPGGGLVNHDLYARACALEGVELVVLLGEGTFHQIHDGASTSRRVTRDDAFADYESIRGKPYEPPSNRPLYLGRVPAAALEHLAYSVRWALGSGSAGDT
jgi:glycosyltransferase involved in cell wall biosynthesis